MKQIYLSLCHIQLEISKETILERPPYLSEWDATKVDDLLEVFDTSPQDEKVINENMTIEEVLSVIFKKIEQQR